MERARDDALSGAYEAAAEALAEAVACGRPRAGRLLAQIRALSGAGDSAERQGASLHDPYVAREAMPLSCAEEVRSGRGHDEWFLGRYPEEDRETVAGVLEGIRQGTLAYEAFGAFGEAVRVARELARRARPEAAWLALLEAAPSWVPLTPTTSRRWACWPTPFWARCSRRNGGVRCWPRRVAPRRPLRRPGPRTPRRRTPTAWAWRGCRLVLVEGVRPDELHRRMGVGGPLLPALRAWDADTRHCSPDAQTWEGRAVVRTGCSGTGWTFAYSGAALDARAARFASPAVAASHGTRALTLVIDHGFANRDGDGRAESFHFSLAEDGQVVHSLTNHGDEVTVTGEVPAYLEPCLRLFGTDPSGPEDEPAPDPVRQTLHAIAAEFGVTLSEEALVDGRLDAFETVSWLREPRSGEAWAYIRMGGPPE